MKTYQSRNLCILSCVSLILVLCCGVDASKSLTKRLGNGFKNNILDRMAHGFGKRTLEDTYDLAPSIAETGTRNWMTLKDLADLMTYDSDLAYRAALKLDTNGDGVISMDEFVGGLRGRGTA
uniref:Sensorin n=2 Tax=Octopus vulgaris TaxID=6645 RepID=A0A1W5FUE7_OCTVU|nr:sensorin [Octopus vulgaris]